MSDIFSDIEVKSVGSPVKEVFYIDDFSSWRFSYGIFDVNSNTYFIAFYPAFCRTNKAIYHYQNKSDFLSDLNSLMDLCGYRAVSEGTVIACVFALSRNKESIELFSEQKYLMDLGFRHYVLDNYYQDNIRSICKEYYDSGTLWGKDIKISFVGGKDHA